MSTIRLSSILWPARRIPPILTRSFGSTATRNGTWGFIGLGQMGELLLTTLAYTQGSDHLPGYPMARNLRAKLPETDNMIICDANLTATKKFVEEVGIAAASAGAQGKGKSIEIASSPREVAEASVGFQFHLLRTHQFFVMSLFYR